MLIAAGEVVVPPSAPAVPGWVLTLALTGNGRLFAALSNGQWYSHVADAPWPPSADSTALPEATVRELSRVKESRLCVQLPISLDDWLWEAELAAAGIGERVVPRYLTDLPNTTPPTASRPPPLINAAMKGMSHLASMCFYEDRPQTFVLAGLAVSAGQREALERTLRAHWREPLLLSEALALSLTQLGLGFRDCRLYGDGLPPIIDPEQGWRPATALSIDIVKSTPLLQALGAEVYAQRLQAYHERCREVIVGLQGSLDVPQGDDGLMAYFGFPVAVEDAAARALTAAWQLASCMSDLALQVRIGVASGQVAVSARQAFGSDVHLAARLRAAAEPGQIFVAPSTRDRVGPGFRLERCGDDLALKDYAGLAAIYRLDGFVTVESGVAPRPGATGRFVGRQRELDYLRQAWVEACGGRLRWCVIQGEAGIGKSRLLHEFMHELRDQGRQCVEIIGQAQGSQSPFVAVVDGLRRHWSLALEDDATLLAHRLAARLPDVVGEGDTAALARLLLAQHDGQVPMEVCVSRRSSDLLLDVFVALANPGPLCLIVDDAHWLDPSTAELLQRLREACSSRSMLVIEAERTEASRAMVIPRAALLDLQGLTSDEARELVGQQGASLSERMRQRVIERAEGIPLYLEESLRMLDQSGSGSGNGVEVPATLEDLLMVRLDSLGPDRALAQLISVLGRGCSDAQLEALLALQDPLVDRARRQGSLASLLNSGLLQKQDGLPPAYRFKHALICDAAYGSLWAEDRRRLHGLCADLIEHGASELWSRRPEELARHLELAGRLGPARRAWQDAAQLAASRGAHHEAAELAHRALSLQPHVSDSAERVRGELRLHLLIASAHIALQGYGSADVLAAYQAAESAGEQLADSAQMIRIRLGLEACYVMRGDLARAGELAGSAVAATDWDRDARLALQARWAHANVQFHQGHWQSALAGFDECLAHYRPALHRRSGVQDPAVMCLGYSSWIHFELGQADEALHRIDRMLALAESLQHPFSTSVALGFAASVKRLCGDVEGAWPHALEAVRVCERGGFQVWLAHALMVRGQLRADRGDAEGGDQDMDRGYGLWFGSGARISCATYLITRAELLLRQGRTRSASEQLDEARRISMQIGEHYYQSELLRLQALCAWQGGDAARAEAGLRRALALAEQQSKPGLALRCGLSLGALEAVQGRCEQAAPRLRSLLYGLPRHGRCRDARWAGQALWSWDRGDVFPTDEMTPWEPK